MEDKDIFLLKYRSHPFLGILLFGLCMLFVVGMLAIDFKQSPFAFILFFLLAVLFAFGGFVLFISQGKEFHMRINRKTKIIEMNLIAFSKKIKIIEMSKIRSISLDKRTHKGSNIFLLQLAVDPQTWGAFYHKNAEKIKKIDAEYEEMYITINISQQKEKDVRELIKFLCDCNLPFVSFSPAILGAYPGTLKSSVYQSNLPAGHKTISSAEKKLQLRQWLNYFLVISFFLTCFLTFLLKFVYMFIGIYW